MGIRSLIGLFRVLLGHFPVKPWKNLFTTYINLHKAMQRLTVLYNIKGHCLKKPPRVSRNSFGEEGGPSLNVGGLRAAKD